MKTYYIYEVDTDQKIGEVQATSIITAEIKFTTLNGQYYSYMIYALITDEGEPIA